MKKEFAACAVGMELPAGHALRNDLANMKKKFEDLLDESSGQKYVLHFLYPLPTVVFERANICIYIYNHVYIHIHVFHTYTHMYIYMKMCMYQGTFPGKKGSFLPCTRPGCAIATMIN